MLADKPPDYAEHFTGKGKESWLACRECADGASLVGVCAGCWARARREGYWGGVTGKPQVAERPGMLRFAHKVRPTPAPSGVRYQPLDSSDTQRYVALTAQGELYKVDLDAQTAERIFYSADLHFENGDLRVSADGQFAAVFEPRGQFGYVVDLAKGRVTIRLDRGTYFVQHCAYSVAFFEQRGRTLLVHPTDWNRLDVSDPATGELLTPRESPRWAEDRPPHYLDDFHCGLAVSQDGQWVVDNGWVWSPIGVMRSWSLWRWLEENVWESEDGPSVRELCVRDAWDAPLCWLDNRRVAVWGYGSDESALIDAVRIFDVTTGREEGWFPIAERGELIYDEWLMSLGENGVDVFGPNTGERLLNVPQLRPHCYHPGARTFLYTQSEKTMVTRLAGHPTPPWLSPDARRVAQAIAEGHDWVGLPVLADALEEAGCYDTRILDHLREGGPHGNDCWAVRRLLHG
jgi:hypothetical protein